MAGCPLLLLTSTYLSSLGGFLNHFHSANLAGGSAPGHGAGPGGHPLGQGLAVFIVLLFFLVVVPDHHGEEWRAVAYGGEGEGQDREALAAAERVGSGGEGARGVERGQFDTTSLNATRLSWPYLRSPFALLFGQAVRLMHIDRLSSRHS